MNFNDLIVRIIATAVVLLLILLMKVGLQSLIYSVSDMESMWASTSVVVFTLFLLKKEKK